jgi:hypothetical protein
MHPTGVQRYEAEQLARTLLDAFPMVEIRERTLGIYAEWLADLDRAKAEEAVAVLIASSMTLPTVAEVRRLVIEEEHEVPTAAEAWISINERGAELHELAQEVAKSFGGVYNIRTSEEPRIVRAQFLKAYEEVRERHLRELNAASYRRRASSRDAVQAA